MVALRSDALSRANTPVAVRTKGSRGQIRRLGSSGKLVLKCHGEDGANQIGLLLGR